MKRGRLTQANLNQSTPGGFTRETGLSNPILSPTPSGVKGISLCQETRNPEEVLVVTVRDLRPLASLR